MGKGRKNSDSDVPPEDQPKTILETLAQCVYSVLFFLLWSIPYTVCYYTGLYRYFWSPIYKFIAKTHRDSAGKGDFMRFMNYGYVALTDAQKQKLKDAEQLIEQEPKDYRNYIRLYEKTLSMCPLYTKGFTGKTLLEVSCGHGGGLDWIKRTHKNFAKVMGIGANCLASEYIFVGLDRCPPEELVERGEVIKGEAMAMPIPDDTYDMVLNVEASHCYHNEATTFEQLMRVIKPGGYLVWCDLRPVELLPHFWKCSKESGLKMVEVENISENARVSCESLAVVREAWIASNPVLWNTRWLWRNFWQLPGSQMHKMFKKKKWEYYTACWQKPMTTNGVNGNQH